VKTSTRRKAAGLVLLSTLTLTLASPVSAAGLYFSERGVRPLARGGAFTAGADDLGAIWYNPAGVFDSGTQFLFDASWLHFSDDYTRKAIVHQRDPNTGQIVSSFEQTFPTVSGSTPVLPIPTIAGSLQVHPDVVVAIGMMAPYAALVSYPKELDGKPAPQRYSLITLDGSLLGVVGAWVGYKPHEKVRLGAGVEMLVGKFVSTTMFSSCVPDKFFCAPEQPEWDTLTQLTAGPIFTPSGNVGLKVLPHKMVKIGAAFQLPFWVRAPATVRAKLPTTPAFEKASQDGEDATVKFSLPWSLRLGVELAPVERLALELDASIEGWAMHDAITVTPKNLALRNVVGFPDPYKLPEQSITRNFRNTASARLGGEYGIPIGDYKLTVRGGLSYESSAIPPEYMSALTVDAHKITAGLGLGMHVGKWRFDAVYAHIFCLDTTVDPRDARAPLLVPVQANVPEPHYVNGGEYKVTGNVLGLGLSYQFDKPRFAMTEAERAARDKNDRKQPKK
jgi:long-chain fatty acid transport protein